jgi:hypothetical protein
MTIKIITTGTPRSQQNPNLPCPWLVECPPEPRR